MLSYLNVHTTDGTIRVDRPRKNIWGQ